MMKNKARKIGPILLAALAWVALSAQAAPASGERFHSDNNTTIITGANEAGADGYFTIVATGDLRCTSSSYKGTVTGEAGTSTAKEMTLRPSFSNCHAFGSENNLTFTTKGCNFVFQAEKSGSDNPMHIECETGHNIIMHTSLCTITIGPQTPTGGVVFTEVLHNNKKSVTANYTVTGFDFTSKSGAGCFVVGTNATITGKFTLTGYADNGADGNATDGFTYTEGNQINIWWA